MCGKCSGTLSSEHRTRHRKITNEVNQRYVAMLQAAKRKKINFFLIQSLKDERGMVKGGKQGKQFGKTGERVPWGFDRLDEFVFTELWFKYDKEEEEYTIEVGKCRHNINMPV